MKQKNAFLLSASLLLFCLSFIVLPAVAQKKNSRTYYQISVYHYKDSLQEKMIDEYLQNALLPALHRMNIKTVGAFKALNNDTSADKTLYVLMPVSSLNDVAGIASHLTADADYNKAGVHYLDAPYDKAPYTRIESILLQAFELAPQMEMPKLTAAKKDRVYELRSYEGATEKLHASKVKMFNAGDEVGIFSRLNFNPVFYAEVLAGSRMPNLMYMTTFENMAEREAHWKAFGSDPAFTALLAMPEYQHNVSKADIIFLRPTDYSDL